MAHGGFMDYPVEPSLLRVYRKNATLFADVKATEAVQTGKDFIDEDFIKTLYSKLMGQDPKEILFRSHQPIIGGTTISGEKKIFDLMPGNQVAPAMREFVKELELRIKNKSDPIDTAIWIERTLVSIHPFKDGNGRLTREVASAYLNSVGLPRPLFLKGEELSFTILPDKDFPMTDYEVIRKIYLSAVERHIKLISDKL